MQNNKYSLVTNGKYGKCVQKYCFMSITSQFLFNFSPTLHLPVIAKNTRNKNNTKRKEPLLCYKYFNFSLPHKSLFFHPKLNFCYKLLTYLEPLDATLRRKTADRKLACFPSFSSLPHNFLSYQVIGLQEYCFFTPDTAFLA